jgi:hypothetical protein
MTTNQVADAILIPATVTAPIWVNYINAYGSAVMVVMGIALALYRGYDIWEKRKTRKARQSEQYPKEG